MNLKPGSSEEAKLESHLKTVAEVLTALGMAYGQAGRAGDDIAKIRKLIGR